MMALEKRHLGRHRFIKTSEVQNDEVQSNFVMYWSQFLRNDYICEILITMRREHILDAIRTGLSNLKIGVEVRLYGSEARGEAHEKSDIDLLVLVPKDKVTLQDELEITAPLYDVELQTGVLINALILPKREWGRKVTPFYENVIQDSIVL